MKIRITPEIAVDVKTTETARCPAGAAYHTIDYLIDGICVHSATTGAIYGSPNPIAMLDRVYTRSETHYQDIPNPNPKPEGDPLRVIAVGTSGGRPAWFEEISQTHRQAIINAVGQLVSDP